MPTAPIARLERPLGVAVLIAALATIPLTLTESQGRALVDADWLIWGVFVVEYVTLLAVAPSPARYVRRRWFELLVVVVSFPLLPGAFGLVRLVRLMRLSRLLVVISRGLLALRSTLARPGLVYLSMATAMLIVTAGALMSIVEPETVKGGLWDGIWWAVVTVTTVGYGDISPTSVPGRLVAMVLMFVGIGLVSTLAATIAAHFVEQDSSSEMKAVQDRLVRIEQLLMEQRKEA